MMLIKNIIYSQEINWNESVYLSNLKKSEFNRLKEHIYHRTYKKGQVLFFAGDKRDRIFILEKGLVRIERLDEQAANLYMNFICPQRLFPLLGMFDAKTYYFSATAVTDIEVYYVSTKIFEDIVGTNLELIRSLNASLNTLMQKHIRRLQYTVSSKAKERVVYTLAILMEDLGVRKGDKTVVPYPLSLKDIASYSGASRETVSQVIKKLVDEGHIHYRYKELIFLDTDYFLLT